MINKSGLFIVIATLLAADYSSVQGSVRLFFGEESLPIVHRIDSLEGESVREKALLYKSEGYFTLAKETFLAGMDNQVASDDPDTEEFAYLMADLGSLYWEKGELSIAHDLYTNAEEILRKEPQASTSQQFLELKINLAIANARLGNNLSAMVGFNQVRTLFEQNFQDNQEMIFNTILRIADVYMDIESLERAEALYSEAEVYLQGMQGDYRVLKIKLLQKNAYYFQKTSELDKSIKSMEESIELMDQVYGKNSLPYSMAIAKLGELYLLNRQYDLAEEPVSKALSVQLGIFGEHHINYLKTLELQADLKRIQKDLRQAEELYSKSLTEWVRQFNLLSPAMGIQEKTSYYTTINHLLSKYASLAEESQEVKGQILSNLIGFEMIVNDLHMHPPAKNESNSTDFTDWRNKMERLLYLLKQPIENIPDGYSTIKKVEEEILDLEKKMSRKDGIQINRGHGNASWKDLRKHLEEDQAAAAIINYPWFSNGDDESNPGGVHYLWISFDKESEEPEGVVLTNGDELENRFLTHYRNSINHKFPDDYAYDMYWKPVKEHFSKYSSIILSTSGAYSQINLLTLRNIETGDFLFDEKRIHLVSSIAHLNLRNGNGKKDPEVYIFGNAVYNLETETPTIEAESYKVYTSQQGESGMYYMKDKIKQQILWNELLYVDDVKYHEVGLLDDLYKSAGFSTSLFTEKTAKEEELKNLVNPYTLHISTHGFFMEDKELNSTISADNPLLHSGLIFSGSFDYLDNNLNSSSSEDGLLTSFEISNLSLDDTKLIFLSSCETGLGIVKNGDAISNFQHAFQEAGAESVIMSLWTTEAEYELEFMNLFYYHWIYEKLTKREAFHKSMMIMKESYEKPYYWGAFTFIGE